MNDTYRWIAAGQLKKGDIVITRCGATRLEALWLVLEAKILYYTSGNKYVKIRYTTCCRGLFDTSYHFNYSCRIIDNELTRICTTSTEETSAS